MVGKKKKRTSFRIDLLSWFEPSGVYHSLFRRPGTTQSPSLSLSVLVINVGTHLPLNGLSSVPSVSGMLRGCRGSASQIDYRVAHFGEA